MIGSGWLVSLFVCRRSNAVSVIDPGVSWIVHCTTATIASAFYLTNDSVLFCIPRSLLFAVHSKKTSAGTAILISPTEFAITIDTTPSLPGTGKRRLSCPTSRIESTKKPVRSPFMTLDGRGLPCTPRPRAAVGKTSLRRARNTDGRPFGIPK
jgi:hypothetical protein